MNNTTNEYEKNNTIKFLLIPSINSSDLKEYIIYGKKIFISTGYYYANISGTLEASISFRGILKDTNELTIAHSKIDYISDTKKIKCLNINFEQLGKDLYLVMHYNNGHNGFHIVIEDLLATESDSIIQGKPILLNENLSKIQEWY